ncbi:MAG: Ig-like domain-containing protein [Melioribacteraceae bacterium]|nr:Ig-like domain-containing protein [Melioribacteraceae bacterium]
MKVIQKIIILLVITISLNAQSLADIKICIDPGHGGHSSDDRFIPATGFWESDANWEKANLLKPMLTDLGATVIITRSGNEDSDDLGLSVRAQIANQNNVDIFHSIHSNGHKGESNYTLMLYKGTDSSPVFPQAKTMGSIMMNDIWEHHRTTNKHNRGDQSFLGFYLGVLNPLTMPGVLSEGSFHDYIPESWRLMSSLYRAHEAKAITKSFLEYFSGGNFTTGQIAGIVRDPLETVNYYYIATTNDGRKPVNNLKVTLQPGDILVNGDDNNNGFFFFDKVEPGTYKLIFEAENFEKDSSNVTVTADKITFADKNLDIVPDLTPPSVVSAYPENGQENVSTKDQIIIEFDIRMDKSSTQGAFTLSPIVSGSFSWENADKRLVFTPTTGFSANKTYTFGINANAKSYFGVNISESASFSFTTRQKLNLVSNYPSDNEEDVSRTVKVIIEFDGAINQNSVFNNINFTDAQNNFVPVSVDNDAYSEGKIIFEPLNPIPGNSSFKIDLKSGLEDIEGLTLGENYEINFTTGPEQSNYGTILDNLEANSGWKDPEYSGSTTGTDPDNTTFSISTTRKVNGNSSGLIKYVFTESKGVCRVYRLPELVLGTSTNDEFGIWAYGDNSNNQLQFWFRDGASQNQVYNFGVINWTGWKLLTVPMSEIGGTGEKKFHSVVIKKNAEGKEVGELYFDDLQIGVLVSVDDNNFTSLPIKFELNQNYPNPFNPTTSIEYSVPSNEYVSLKVYDILGNEIAQLVNEQKSAGSYSVNFNAANLASGVYFYKITAGSFTQIRKMMFLK